MALTSKQIRGIPLLLTEESQEKAARKIGVSRSAIVKWMQNPEFRKALDESRSRVLKKSMDRLSRVVTKAVDTLEMLLVAESEAVRKGAADSIISHCLRWKELQEFEGRLETVERVIFERRRITNDESFKASEYVGESD